MNRVLLLCAFVALYVVVYAQPSAELEALFATKEQQLTTLGQGVLTSYRNRGTYQCTCSHYDCKTTSADFDSCSTRHGFRTCAKGRALSYNTSMVSKLDFSQTNVELQSTECWTQQLEPFFKANEYDTTITWQYIGTPQGFFRGYPGVSNPECGYDPRDKTWYIAPTSGPKDIILVIDVSGSMTEAGRIDTAKEAAKTIIDTLNIFDYFAVVTFSDSARTLGSATKILQRASKANKQTMLGLIDGLIASGGTQFTAGFQEAFTIFNNSIRSEITTSCNRAILFMTDGISTLDYGLVDYWNANVRATFFSYSFGVSADTTIPKTLSCRSNGLYAPVDDFGNLVGQMGNYYQYYATLRPTINISNGLGNIVWTEPYLDETGAGEMVTAGVSVYDVTQNPPLLIGVVGIDVTLATLSTVEPDYNSVLTALITRSNKCFRVTLSNDTTSNSYCSLEYLRSRVYASALTTSLDRTRACGTTCGTFEPNSTAAVPGGGFPEYCRVTGTYTSCCPGGGAAFVNSPQTILIGFAAILVAVIGFLRL